MAPRKKTAGETPAPAVGGTVAAGTVATLTPVTHVDGWPGYWLIAGPDGYLRLGGTLLHFPSEAAALAYIEGLA